MQIFLLVSNDEVQPSESHSRSRLKRHHGLPPVTPNACIREGVMNLAFNNLWTEVISILQPLIAAIRENYSQGGFRVAWLNVGVPQLAFLYS